MAADGVIQTRSFEYDHRGFLLSETHPERDKATRHSGYDARGHATREIDGAENGPFDVTYAYDAAERLLTVRETSSSRQLKVHLRDDEYERRMAQRQACVGDAVNVLTNGTTISVSDSLFYAGRDGQISKSKRPWRARCSPVFHAKLSIR